MPFTFLGHQGVVAPLKLLRPAWFSGTALVIGSMAPDFEYFLRGEPISTVSHTVLGQLTFCLPATLALVWLVQRVIARPLAACMPDLGGLRLRDYGLLAASPDDRAPWAPKVIVSALVGSFSHIAWDGLTHADGWAVGLLPSLGAPAFVLGGWVVPFYKVLQHASTLAGALVTLWVMRSIGRRRLLLAWSGQVGQAAGSPAATSVGLLVAPVVIASVAGALWSLLGSGPEVQPLALGVRALLRATSCAFGGLVLGALFVTHQERLRGAVAASGP